MTVGVNIQQLVETRIQPVFLIKADFGQTVATEIEAQIALKGWISAALTDQERVYIAALTLEALMVPLLFLYPEEIQEITTGEQTVKLPPRDRFFELLRKAIADLKQTAAKAAAPADAEAEADKPVPWPGVGVVGF